MLPLAAEGQSMEIQMKPWGWYRNGWPDPVPQLSRLSQAQLLMLNW